VTGQSALSGLRHGDRRDAPSASTVTHTGAQTGAHTGAHTGPLDAVIHLNM
jgi:hypothetical protein